MRFIITFLSLLYLAISSVSAHAEVFDPFDSFDDKNFPVVLDSLSKGAAYFFQNRDQLVTQGDTLGRWEHIEDGPFYLLGGLDGSGLKMSGVYGLMSAQSNVAENSVYFQLSFKSWQDFLKFRKMVVERFGAPNKNCSAAPVEWRNIGKQTAMRMTTYDESNTPPNDDMAPSQYEIVLRLGDFDNTCTLNTIQPKKLVRYDTLKDFLSALFNNKSAFTSLEAARAFLDQYGHYKIEHTSCTDSLTEFHSDKLGELTLSMAFNKKGCQPEFEEATGAILRFGFYDLDSNWPIKELVGHDPMAEVKAIKVLNDLFDLNIPNARISSWLSESGLTAYLLKSGGDGMNFFTVYPASKETIQMIHENIKTIKKSK